MSAMGRYSRSHAYPPLVIGLFPRLIFAAEWTQGRAMAVISDGAEHGGRLLRVLGTSFGIAVGTGAMIGAGIMRAPSSMAALVPNGYVLIGLLLFGAAVITLGCNIVAEMATAMPRDGGGYVYARRAFGDVAGLAVGWTMWMSIVAGVAALCVTFADFLGALLPMTPADEILVAAAMQGLLFAYNYAGIREGRFATQITSALKAIALLAFVIAAFLFAPHVAPVTHPMAATTVPLGFAGIIAAYQLIDGAYAGWDVPIAFTGENEDPSRAIPRSLFGGVAATAVLYLAVMAVMLATLGAKDLAATPSPFSLIAGVIWGPSSHVIVAGIAMLVVLSCAHSNLIGAPRVIYALTEDRLLPAGLGRVNRGGTPHIALAMTSLASLALTLTGSFDLVFGLIATVNAANAILIYAAFFVLRRKEPDLPRPYRAFGYPWLPAIPLIVAAGSFVLYVEARPVGALYALALWAMCVPLAMLARRTQAPASDPAPVRD